MLCVAKSDVASIGHWFESLVLFFVMKLRVLIKLRDGEVRIGPGEFVVIPRGVDLLPVAEDEVHVIWIKPKTTLNTESVIGDKTFGNLKKL